MKKKHSEARITFATPEDASVVARSLAVDPEVRVESGEGENERAILFFSSSVFFFFFRLFSHHFFLLVVMKKTKQNKTNSSAPRR